MRENTYTLLSTKTYYMHDFKPNWAQCPYATFKIVWMCKKITAITLAQQYYSFEQISFHENILHLSIIDNLSLLIP